MLFERYDINKNDKKVFVHVMPCKGVPDDKVSPYQSLLNRTIAIIIS